MGAHGLVDLGAHRAHGAQRRLAVLKDHADLRPPEAPQLPLRPADEALAAIADVAPGDGSGLADQAGAAYERDRARTARANIKDEYTCTDIDAMEAIARRVPLSRIARPAWDLDCLKRLGAAQPAADPQIWSAVWSDEEKINFRATPLFMVSAQRA
ncbi:MAG: hypothetical protein ACI4MF_01710 [Candidatus Faecivicinus sp.]